MELVRSADGVEARSLWCTHYGCEVAWSAAQSRYLCPCHEGVFDADGRVVSGPPPRPLQRLEVRLTESAVVIEAAELHTRTGFIHLDLARIPGIDPDVVANLEDPVVRVPVTTAKIFGWYDNEAGYASRMVDMMKLVASK